MRRQCALVFLAVLLQTASALEVIVDYSFSLPKQFGKGNPKDICCPWARLPNNHTSGMLPPTIVGIGTQKGGTSTFYVHLRAHPQLQSTNKELHYLDEVGSETYRHYLQKWPFNKALLRHKYGRNRGRGLRADWQAPRLFEISPSYMFIPYAACKAKWVVPSAKFVVFLREPADRAYSGVTHETNVMSSSHGGKYKWMHRTFKEHMLQGIQELILDPKCDFHTGKGRRTYNDCVGCMVRWAKVQGNCAFRPFVNLINEEKKHTCTSIGKEHVLRGLYGPQLAWWFTMFDPSQFMIINSNAYFENPLAVLQNITTFLGLTRPYSTYMLKRSPKKANVGHYWKVNQTMIAQTKSILRQFYKRPNLELYRLLKETGHHDFAPFEKYLQDKDVLNCTEPQVIESGICGAQLFGSSHSMFALIEDARTKGLQNVLAERKKEKPQPVNASQHEVEFSQGVTVVENTPEVKKTKTEPRHPPSVKQKTADSENETKDKTASSNSGSWTETEAVGITKANGMTPSFDQKDTTDEIKDEIPKIEKIGHIKNSPSMKDSTADLQSAQSTEDMAQIIKDQTVTASKQEVDQPTIIYRSSSIYTTTRRPVGQLGISHSDFVIHFIFGAFLVGVSLYGFRSLRRNRRVAR